MNKQQIRIIRWFQYPQHDKTKPKYKLAIGDNADLVIYMILYIEIIIK